MNLVQTVITWALSSLAGAFLGSYLAGYLRRKGENLATHEDIDKLVDQVRAVTIATKEIEAKISGDVWDRQKQWELRRDVLFEASKRLSEVENKLLSLASYWRMRVKGEIQDEGSRIRLEHQYVTDWQRTAHAFEEVESLIQVTCSLETMKAFAVLSDHIRSTVSKIVSDDVEIYEKTNAERNKHTNSVRIAIRKELGIALNSAPYRGDH